MRALGASLLAIAATAATAQSVFIEQTGPRQQAELNLAAIAQVQLRMYGEDNRIALRQSADGSGQLRANLLIDGRRNGLDSPAIIQSGHDIELTLAVAGESHNWQINQQGPGALSARLIQQGEAHRLWLDQRTLVPEAQGNVLLQQIGSGHEAWLGQTTSAGSNRIRLQQAGKDHLARVEQYGEDNFVSADQLGSGNEFQVAQYGKGNEAVLVQDGNHLIAPRVEQYGGMQVLIQQYAP